MPLFVEASFDLEDGEYVLDVVESGAGGAPPFTITMDEGEYFLRTDGAAATGDLSDEVAAIDDFLGDLQTALNAETGGGAYTVSFSTTTERVTIAHNGAGSVTGVQLTPTTNGGIIGQTAVKSGALSHEMQRVPDYWISGDLGFWGGYVEREDKDAGVTVRAHSGRPHGIAYEGVATLLDLVVPTEPREKVYTDYGATVSPLQPFTWQALFRHARNVHPLCIDDGDFQHFVVLTDEGAVFAPRAVSRDYIAVWDVLLRTQLLGRVAL